MGGTMHYCYNCGKPVMDEDETCLFCGAVQAEPDVTQTSTYQIPTAGNPYQKQAQAPAYAVPGRNTTGTPQKSKMAAGLLAIFLGMFGVHKFYLGYTSQGLVMLLISICSFGIAAWVMEIVGIIEGVLYLTKTDQDFYATYEVGYKPWF